MELELRPWSIADGKGGTRSSSLHTPYRWGNRGRRGRQPLENRGAATPATRVHGALLCQGWTGQGPRPVTRTPERGSLWAQATQQARKRGLPRALAPSTPSAGSGLAPGWERASSGGLEELGEHWQCGAPRGHDYTPSGGRHLMLCRPQLGNGALQQPPCPPSTDSQLSGGTQRTAFLGGKADCPRFTDEGLGAQRPVCCSSGV